MKPTFDASNVARVIACPGSYALEKQFKTDEYSQSQQEGIAAHWLAAKILKEGLPAETAIAMIGSVTPSGEIITCEMAEGAILFETEVVKKTGYAQLLVENQLILLEKKYVLVGRPDCAAFVDDTLYIFDYKFGHRPVDAVGNKQLIAYIELLMTQDHSTTKKIVNTIVQPRCFSAPKVREWEVTFEEFQQISAEFKASLNASVDAGFYERVSGECYFCSAKHACGTLQKSALTFVDIGGFNSPHVLDGELLGNELRLLEHAKKILDTRITGLAEQALGYLRNGQRVNHYHAEPTIGNQRWTKTTEEIAQLGALFNVDLLKAPELISPAQALKKGLPEEIIKESTHRARGAMKLVKDDNSKASKIFNQLNQE